MMVMDKNHINKNNLSFSSVYDGIAFLSETDF